MGEGNGGGGRKEGGSTVMRPIVSVEEVRPSSGDGGRNIFLVVVMGR